MGLDGVELVMEVEDRFGVALLDSECARVRTVADLAAIVISRLPRVSSGCPNARSFFLIRRLLVQQTRVSRGRVRPGTRWDELFPTDLARVWSGLREVESGLPRLVHSRQRADVIRIGVLAAVLCSVACGAAAWQQQGAAAGSLALALGLTVTAVGRSIADTLRSSLPWGIETVGDLARRLGSNRVTATTSDGGPGQPLIAQQRVLDEIRAITSEQLGVPLERVRPESDFVKELGMG